MHVYFTDTPNKEEIISTLKENKFEFELSIYEHWFVVDFIGGEEAKPLSRESNGDILPCICHNNFDENKQWLYITDGSCYVSLFHHDYMDSLDWEKMKNYEKIARTSILHSEFCDLISDFQKYSPTCPIYFERFAPQMDVVSSWVDSRMKNNEVAGDEW